MVNCYRELQGAASELIKAVEETVSVLWEGIKEFMDSDPEFREMLSLYLSTEKSENESSFWPLFRVLPFVKVYLDQVNYRTVFVVARSRC